jgi:hypothetical protein
VAALSDRSTQKKGFHDGNTFWKTTLYYSNSKLRKEEGKLQDMPRVYIHLRAAMPRRHLQSKTLFAIQIQSAFSLARKSFAMFVKSFYLLREYVQTRLCQKH